MNSGVVLMDDNKWLVLCQFQDAADWLHSHPLVQKQGIGAVGVSKGAALAMQMAILNAKVFYVTGYNIRHNPHYRYYI